MHSFSFLTRENPQAQPETPRPIIALQAVTKAYKTIAGSYLVLKGIDLALAAGEFVSIVGKSGSGKTTLLNMISGIDRPSSGEVWVNQTALHTLNEGQMAHWRGRNLGIVFQFFQLLPTLSVLENIMLPMDFCGKLPYRERKPRALHLLELVGLSDQACKLPLALSGGQQQRVAISRALANDPPVLIADEPTGNLDSKTADSVFELFHDLAAQGKSVVIVTHDGSLASRTHRTIPIVDGEIVEPAMAQPFYSPAFVGD
jgi:putative ABC transport system ATP-binding protein